MSFFPKPPSIIGLEREGNQIRICKLSAKKKKWEIESLETIDLKEKKENVKPLDFLLSQIAGKDAVIATAISSKEVLTRQLDLPLKNEKDLKEALPFQAEPLLPCPVQNCVLQYVILSKHSMGTHLTVFALKKDHLKKHLEEWESLGVEVEKTTAQPDSLSKLVSLFSDEGPTNFLLHVGESSSTCIYVENQNLVFSRFCSVGRKNIESENFSSQIKKTILGFETQFKDKNFDKILITGIPSNKIPFFEALAGKKIIIPKLSQKTEEQLSTYAIAIGTAYAATSRSIDFRQGELAYPKKWKRFKKPLFIYFSLCGLLSVVLFTFGKIYLNQTLSELQQRYLSLLTLEEKNYADFEANFDNTKEPPPASALSQNAIKKRVALLEKEIKSKPDTFPLMPKLPKVTDLLAWIETHPEIANASKNIIISSLRYQMIKRPEIGQKQEKYQVKVELEFTATSPSVARSFHEALRYPNLFVDPENDVGWSASGGKYKATFFLKDETAYK